MLGQLHGLIVKQQSHGNRRLSSVVMPCDIIIIFVVDSLCPL